MLSCWPIRAADKRQPIAGKRQPHKTLLLAYAFGKAQIHLVHQYFPDDFLGPVDLNPHRRLRVQTVKVRDQGRQPHVCDRDARADPQRRLFFKIRRVLFQIFNRFQDRNQLMTQLQTALVHGAVPANPV